MNTSMKIALAVLGGLTAASCITYAASKMMSGKKDEKQADSKAEASTKTPSVWDQFVSLHESLVANNATLEHQESWDNGTGYFKPREISKQFPDIKPRDLRASTDSHGRKLIIFFFEEGALVVFQRYTEKQILAIADGGFQYVAADGTRTGMSGGVTEEQLRKLVNGEVALNEMAKARQQKKSAS